MSQAEIINLASYVINAARDYPENTALKLEDTAICYSDFDLYIRRCQAYLLQCCESDKRGSLTILAFKSIDALALSQAALRCGFSYTVIDPRYPADRIRKILLDSQPTVLYTDQGPYAIKELIQELPDALVVSENSVHAIVNPQTTLDEIRRTDPVAFGTVAVVDLSTIAFVFYTSGSTGIPKGVGITHANAGYSVDWAQDALQFKGDDVFLNQAHMGFDFCVLDYYNAWNVAASIVLVPEYTALFSSEVVDLIKKERVTNLWLVPSNVVSLIKNGGLLDIDASLIRRFLYAGEPFPVKYLKLVYGWMEGREVYNLYGPCETNILTYRKVTEADLLSDSIPIGRSIPGTRLKLLADDGEILDRGKGELLANSPSVFGGYTNNGKDKSAYLMTIDDETWYRTGDICAIDETDCVHYKGRTDSMVKIRGYRVELQEIELALDSHTNVTRSVALAKETCAEDSYEVYVFCVVSGDVDENSLAQYAGENLPTYMIPERIIIVDEIPFNDRGKVDKTALFEYLFREVA